jgi:hypothetical protein
MARGEAGGIINHGMIQKTTDTMLVVLAEPEGTPGFCLIIRPAMINDEHRHLMVVRVVFNSCSILASSASASTRLALPSA